jgi:hypothetical protein
MSGYNTLWVPGVDHAGIATQVIFAICKWQECEIHPANGLDDYKQQRIFYVLTGDFYIGCGGEEDLQGEAANPT